MRLAPEPERLSVKSLVLCVCWLISALFFPVLRLFVPLSDIATGVGSVNYGNFDVL